MYHSIGVVRNSRVTRRTSPYEAVGQTIPLNRNAVVVTGPIGTRRATGVTTGPTRRTARAAPC